jgi:hypothetical protein
MSEDEAKKRFILLNIVRMAGVALVFAGAANIGGKLLPEFTPLLGYVLLVAGAVDFFAAPVLLKNLWRTPDA